MRLGKVASAKGCLGKVASAKGCAHLLRAGRSGGVPPLLRSSTHIRYHASLGTRGLLDLPSFSIMLAGW